VVAEGIETDEQLSYLKRSGCDMGQGYLFSRPLPADQLIAFIGQHNS
jgi:EAL domain-containing protein (putative c-di-GMP-specific phosphodiesterase class I)